MQIANKKLILGIVVGLLVVLTLMGWYWSRTPDNVALTLENQSGAQVPGSAMSASLVNVLDTLLHKPGGYLANDVMPPGVFMDNMPAWEFGVLEMSRDLALVMRRDFSRSQSQSTEHPKLAVLLTELNIDNKSWILPSAESSYEKGRQALMDYHQGLMSQSQQDAQFYARADNLREWLKLVEKRLGSLSQRLSASVGQQRINTDLAGERRARQSTQTASETEIKTSWFKLDNNFYEARGACWSLLQFLRAAEVDFADVLEDKNALISLRQIIRELEATQETVFSPMILNGSGFGPLANHSLVMANYISRANAALIDLSELLQQG